MAKTLLLGLTLLLASHAQSHVQETVDPATDPPQPAAVSATAPSEGSPPPVATLQATSREGLEWLQPTVGTWQMQARFTPDDGTTWHQVTTDATVTTLLGGRFLHEAFYLQFPNGQRMHIECTRSYDNFQKLYRAVCLDDAMALMDVYEGTWHEQKLVLSNVGPNTFFLTGPQGAIKVNSRQILHSFTQDGFQVDWEATADGGKTWSPAGFFTYSHHKPEGLGQKPEDEIPPQ